MKNLAKDLAQASICRTNSKTGIKALSLEIYTICTTTSIKDIWNALEANG